MKGIGGFLDHMGFVDKIEACVDKGVTERPPIAGLSYVAFAVYPPKPGNLLALAIAHRAGDQFVVDVVKDDIGIADASVVLKRYHISQVTGAEGDASDALAYAVAGAINLLRLQ
jgi:hypothetical protein